MRNRTASSPKSLQRFISQKLYDTREYTKRPLKPNGELIGYANTPALPTCAEPDGIPAFRFFVGNVSNRFSAPTANVYLLQRYDRSRSVSHRAAYVWSSIGLIVALQNVP